MANHRVTNTMPHLGEPDPTFYRRDPINCLADSGQVNPPYAGAPLGCPSECGNRAAPGETAPRVACPRALAWLATMQAQAGQPAVPAQAEAPVIVAEVPTAPAVT